MELQKIDAKWIFKDITILGTAKPHGDMWHLFGRNMNDGSPFETFAKTEKQAKFLLKRYCTA